MWLMDRQLSVDADHLLQELRLRLRQLEWLYGRCMELDRRIEREGRQALPDGSALPAVMKQIFREQSFRVSNPQQQAQLPFQPQDELWIFLEAFYNSAHRVRNILRDNRHCLPGLHTFEAPGVRTARNHLVEHTGRKGGVLIPSIACGGPVGPQLRQLRWSQDKEGSHDPGLPANAREFAAALQATLVRAQRAPHSAS